MLSVMYLAAVGYVVILYGIDIRNTEGYFDGPFKDSLILVFSGGIITATFWV